MAKTWGGRFDKPTDALVERFTESISFDHKLADVDIEGSLAHVEALQAARLLSAAETKTLSRGLRKVREQIRKGRLKLDVSLEDIHTLVETALTREVGPVAGKLHTARSRNDQVATDLRLYMRLCVADAVEAGLALIETLASGAEREKSTVMPGYTHLQRAMPVTLGHHLAAYAHMFTRDMDRFLTAWDRASVLPLGSGALAGTNHPLDRLRTARRLGFQSAALNSLDAVADRDFLVDFLSACASTQMHLSRLCEDLVLWASAEFGYLVMEDSVATGSSLMPQKKNPDVAELVRGKTGRVYADLIGLLTVLKGLPLAYNRDLQEDKVFLFDAHETVTACLKIMEHFLNHVRFQAAWMDVTAQQDPTLLATDLADVLVKQGMPFRQAHEVVGRVVRSCLAQRKRLQDLEDSDLWAFSRVFPKGTAASLSVQASVNGKKALGGTSPVNVSSQVRALKTLVRKMDRRIPRDPQ
jgi:argininosuccinate lyase